MKRIVGFSLVLALCGCNFAVKHPGVTVGIVAGSVALTTCELASEDHKNCFIAGGAVGIGLSLIAGFALWLGTEDEPAPTTSAPPPKVDWDKIPDTTPKEPTKAPPAPTPPPGDAGVPTEPTAPSPPADAGAPIAPPDAAP